MSLQKSRRADSPPESASVHLHALFAAEEHLAEDAADVFLGGVLVELVQPVVDGHARLDGGDEVLRRSSRSAPRGPT
jgi:hypothetical protein